jgi:hypothetical protein
MLISGMGVHQCMYVCDEMYVYARMTERAKYARVTRCVCMSPLETYGSAHGLVICVSSHVCTSVT